MQTRSRTRSEPEEVPLQFNHERTRVPTAPIEPRDNSHEESLQRRITELEAQLRAATIQTLQLYWYSRNFILVTNFTFR